MTKEESIDYNLKATWHAISRMYNQFGQSEDITATTGFVLLNIDAEFGTPATKIAPSMGLEVRSLTRLLKSLEEKNWIYRKQDESDKRSQRIFLTELGKEKRELSRYAVKQFNKIVYEVVSKEKLSVFFNVLQEINQIVNQKVLFHQIEAENL